MTREERERVMATAVAVAAVNPLVPGALRVGLAALVEEVRELRARIKILEGLSHE